MALSQLKKFPRLFVVLAVITSFSVPAAVANAASKSYFKAFGSDVMTGGWFASGSSCDTSTSSNYQDPYYTATGYAADNRTGGILTYAKENGSGQAAGGASGQYGVYSLGSIEGSDTNSYGFYSDGAQAGKVSRAYLTFSNTGLSSTYWGGSFDGSVRQSSCIPDYYSKVPTNPPPPAISTLTSNTASGTYSASAGAGTNFSLTNSDVNLGTDPGGAGKRITIYVNGNVYIGNNITYTLDKENDVPKLTIIAKGNIYIDANVTQLAGWYIAQPATNNSSTPSADDGNFWTCHPNNTSQLFYTYAGNCSKKLVIDGAITAKQVNFMRTNGDVSSASTSEDNVSNALGSNNIAEVINYIPAMVIGGPFFNQPAPTSLPVDSLISLPPVF